MLKKTLAILAVSAAMTGAANADIIGDLPGVQGAINDMMGNEMGNLGDIIVDLPPIIDCGCPHLCGWLAMMGRGLIPPAMAQQELVSALLQDQTNGTLMAVKMGGKFDPELMGRVSVKMEYSDTFDAKRVSALMQRASKAVFR